MAATLPPLHVIISYRHGFTFIHCPKTAGSSVAIFLSQHLGPRDLQLGSWTDCWKHGTGPNARFFVDVFRPSTFLRAAQKIATHRSAAITALSQIQKQKYRSVLGPEPEHAAAAAIQAFDQEAWQRHFKFCFVRNPYDRAVSHHLWREEMNRASGRPSRTFLEFLTLVEKNGLVDNGCARPWDLYTIDGKVAVDFVGRFERLSEDMQLVADQIGVRYEPLMHAKKAVTRASYQEYYTAAERAKVEYIFRREIQYFGYGF